MSSSNPKISVIVPSFNQGKFIEETILSILKQTYRNFEIIIIDGASTDTSVEIIKKYQEHLRYWVSEKDKGQSEAINKGLSIASGEIVTWLNSDDYYEKDTLEIVAKTFLENPTTDIIHGKSRLFGEKIKSAIIGLEKDIAIEEYLSFMRFPQPSSFFKRQFLSQDFQVNEALHYTMDFELLARALLGGAQIKRVDHLLSNYRMHPESKSNDEIKFLDEWALIVCKIFNSFDEGQRFAEEFKILDLASVGPADKFENKITLTALELEHLFLQHLNLHYHINYRALRAEKCRVISVFLEKNYRGFSIKNKYKKYNFRLKFIPPFVFDLIRKSKR